MQDKENQVILSMANDIATKQKHIMEDFSIDILWKHMEPSISQIQRKFIEQEVHWIQRTKQDLLLLGDRNTKFFQTMATIKKRHNTIRKIKDAQGIWFDDQPGITEAITKEFENRFNRNRIVIRLMLSLCPGGFGL